MIHNLIILVGLLVAAGSAFLARHVLPTPAVFPELARLSTTYERRSMLRRAAQAASRGPGTALLAASGLCLAGALGYIVWTLDILAFDDIPWSFTLLGLVLLSWQPVLPGRRAAIRRHLRRYLNAKGLRTCLTCGYDLTGNTSSICPECGTTVQGAPCLFDQ